MHLFKKLFLIYCIIQFGTHFQHLTTADEKPLRSLLRVYKSETPSSAKPLILPLHVPQ